MGLLLLMYISQKVFLTFTWSLLPLLMRQQQFSLQNIGFSALVYSPWALKFLYAFLVDRYYVPRFGKRKSWILPLMAVSLLMLPLLSTVSPQDHLKPLLGAIFALNLIFATIDIAVDGYATDILAPRERALGNTIQTVGYVIGYMLGAGVFLMIFQHRGWGDTLRIMAALQLLMVIPIALHRELPAVLPDTGQPSTAAPESPAPARALFQRPEIPGFLLLAGLLVLVDQGGAQLRLPMISDRNVSPLLLGRINLWFSSPMCLLGALAGGALLQRFGNRPTLIFGCVAAAGVNFLSAAVSSGLWTGWGAVGILLGSEKLASGILNVFIYSMVMTLSTGRQSATNYAVLASFVTLFGIGLNPVVGRFCDAAGYLPLYAGLGSAGILGIFTGHFLLARIPELYRKQPPGNKPTWDKK